MNHQVMWMVKAGTSHLAPYYGIASQRKQVLANLKERGIELASHYRIVKVIVTEVTKK